MNRCFIAACLVFIMLLMTHCTYRDTPYYFHGAGVSGVQLSSDRRHYRSRQAYGVMLSSHIPQARLTPIDLDNSPQNKLRALTGTRTNNNDVQTMIQAAAGLDIIFPKKIRQLKQCSHWVYTAQQRTKIPDRTNALTGNLIVFGTAKKPKSFLCGIIINKNEQDTVEYLYLSRQIIRRGFMNLNHPSKKRDSHGRVLNTFIKGTSGGASGSIRYLAGRRFFSYLPVSSLLP